MGIEVPNKDISTVTLREVIDSGAFVEAKSKLSVALGRDIAGNLMLADLAKMPHVLIAGATGSGKSVCINSIIMSILYKATDEEVKLLMIDPKVVDFIKEGQTHTYDNQVMEEIEKNVPAEKGAKSSSGEDGGGFDDHDDLLMDAIECVVEAGQASTSMIQRRLKVGYAGLDGWWTKWRRWDRGPV